MSAQGILPHLGVKDPSAPSTVPELGTVSNNQNGNLRWFLPLGVDPPLNGTNFQTIFYPTFFSLAIESYI